MRRQSGPEAVLKLIHKTMPSAATTNRATHALTVTSQLSGVLFQRGWYVSVARLHAGAVFGRDVTLCRTRQRSATVEASRLILATGLWGWGGIHLTGVP